MAVNWVWISFNDLARLYCVRYQLFVASGMEAFFGYAHCLNLGLSVFGLFPYMSSVKKFSLSNKLREIGHARLSFSLKSV